ncbi:hypothetical protein OAD66_05520 [Bacteroidia bacterium]|nr:hypothetical protein [Bacteroidia bacterium]MDB9882575.1 hypothetical protein [Bacteroidia bacterium]
MDISGDWAGVLTYGKGYDQFTGEKLWFEMKVEQESDRFTGIANDIRGFVTNESPASIEGIISNGEIKFFKTYEKEAIFNEFWESEYADNPSLPIEDIGSYDEEKDKFFGKWRISQNFKILFIIPWKVISEGTWSTKRII